MDIIQLQLKVQLNFAYTYLLFSFKVDYFSTHLSLSTHSPTHFELL